MIFPLMLLDACVSFHQWSCFPIYGITKVRRADYLVFDRSQLHYLNFIEKLHCSLCEYGNGLMGYTREILARTEACLCPIKHAKKIIGTHARYSQLLDYGDATDYEARREAFRVTLGQIK